MLEDVFEDGAVDFINDDDIGLNGTIPGGDYELTNLADIFKHARLDRAKENKSNKSGAGGAGMTGRLDRENHS